jgi:predicted aconitase with swiveling domain
MIIKGCKKIVAGLAEGPSLVTSQPINFLAMIDAASGKVTDRTHELYGKSVKGTVLCFPHAIGSSVGAYSIYSLKEKGSAPSAVVCSKADITTASGCAIAGIPVVGLPEGVEIGTIPQGKMTHVDATGDHAIVKV